MFADALKTWGPEALARRAEPVALDEAEAYCRRLAKQHYENFPIASWLLPRPLHSHFYHVYAFCRWADDLGDEVGDPQRSLELLAWWRDELADCYRGRMRHPVFVALGRTIREFDIPAAPFEDLIAAFEQDQSVHEYETFDQLRDYCRRSADPVGRIVLSLCRRADARTLAWSDSVCTGLQLANFWQDVSRDYDIGRVYLPREDRRRFGYDDESLRRRVTNEPFRELMAFEVDRAEAWLRDGLPLVEHVPGRLQVDIDLFIRGGLKILEEIRGIGYDVWQRRPVVAKRHFAALLIGSLGRAVRRSVRRKGRP